MRNTTGLPTTDDREQVRQRERDMAMRLVMPFFAMIIVPIFCFMAAGVAGRHDLLTVGFKFAQDYETLVLVVLALTLPPLVYAFYLIVGKGVAQIWRNAREREIAAKFTPDYYEPLPRSLVLCVWAWAAGVVVILAILAYLYLA